MTETTINNESNKISFDNFDSSKKKIRITSPISLLACKFMGIELIQAPTEIKPADSKIQRIFLIIFLAYIDFADFIDINGKLYKIRWTMERNNRCLS